MIAAGSGGCIECRAEHPSFVVGDVLHRERYRDFEADFITELRTENRTISDTLYMYKYRNEGT